MAMEDTSVAARFVRGASQQELADVERAEVLARSLSLPFDDLSEFHVEAELFRQIPVDVMLRYQFVPVERQGDVLVVVMSDPSNVLAVDEVELAVGSPIEVRVGPARRIAEILEKSESTQRVLDEATEDFRIQLVQERENGEETLTIESITADTSPIIKLVDTIVFNAIQRRASDIHIETRDLEVIVKYRIDGVLYQAMEPIDKRYHSAIISRIKVMSELDIAEKRVPQDGRFKLRMKGRTIDFRVSVMPTVHGEDVVIRILDKESANKEFRTLNLEVLGFDEDTKKKLRKFIREPYGMVLVTGPTGSGKTTTLYACLSEIVSVEDKIVTIEDPVEYQLPGITQIPVNEKKGLTFARGLRSILRHDPDKIMVGEIRDAETAQIAVQSALTGHLVFTTVHANNVVDVLGRFLNMDVDLYNFVSALNCILAQRLVRRICPHCQRPAQVSRQMLEESGLLPEQVRGVVFHEGAGCIECNGTGFLGRCAISELLDLSDNIRALIIDKRPAAEIKRTAKAEGMKFLRESALEKVFAGVTTLKEINKVTFVE
jgi:type II secretory ATPase GspE/PulE/Tfp pilus assembly ATPase PilB-like protein